MAMSQGSTDGAPDGGGSEVERRDLRGIYKGDQQDSVTIWRWASGRRKRPR